VMSAWMAWALVWERGSRVRVPVLVGAGLVAVVALLPYLNELRTTSSGVPTTVANGPDAPGGDGSMASGPPHLLRFGVRHMIDPDSLLSVPWFASLARSHPRVEDAIAGLVLLLPGYFVELGFYGVVLAVALKAARRSRLDEPLRTSLVLAGAGLLVASLLRSAVIEHNDFGMRSVLVAQFFLLLIAVRWCEGAFGETTRTWRAAIHAMVWIGLAGTLYQAVELRLYLPVEEMLGRPQVAGLSERAMALRRGFDEMAGRVPKDAVIQFNTAQPSDFFRYAQVMQAGRQVANALPGCATPFGGDASACKGVEEDVARLFSQAANSGGGGSGGALPATEARVECGRLGASYLVATRWDSVWADREGWVWKLPAAADTGDVRVLGCAEPIK